MTRTLRRSQDRKVSVWHGLGGGNSFGLPAGISCPGATSVCSKICYAGRIEMYPAVRNVLMNNWDILKDASVQEATALLDAMILEFVKESDRRGVEKKFRIHWDGDFFSADYARAWAVVIGRHQDVQFWAYTRTFEVVEFLAGLDNLSLYLSVDKENIEQAKATRKAFPAVRWAFLGETMEEGSTPVKSMTGRPGAKCPENIKKIPLITGRRGACISCDICVAGKADVRFAIKKK